MKMNENARGKQEIDITIASLMKVTMALVIRIIIMIHDKGDDDDSDNVHEKK